MTERQANFSGSAIFDLLQIADNFPDSAETMLIDTRMTDESAASARVFRIYTPVPEHYHATCDEYLLVLSGKGTMVIDGLGSVALDAGKMAFFKRGTIHAIPEIVEAPFVFLAVDTPRRDPKDVIFATPDGTVREFMETRQLY